MRRRFCLGLVAAAMLSVGTVRGQPGQDASEAEILTIAASLARFEVAAGELAQRSTRPDVQALGRDRAAFGLDALAQLEQAARERGVTLPEGMVPQHAAALAGLEPLDGVEFDRRYGELATETLTQATTIYKAAEARGLPVATALLPRLEALRLASEAVRAATQP